MSMGLLLEFWSSGLLSSPQAWVSTGSGHRASTQFHQDPSGSHSHTGRLVPAAGRSASLGWGSASGSQEA